MFPFIGGFSIKNHVPSFNLPQGHTFKGQSFRKWGNNGIVEVDLIVEVKYFREEGVNSLWRWSTEQRGGPPKGGGGFPKGYGSEPFGGPA